MLKRLALAGISIASLIVVFRGGGAGFSVTSVNGVEHVSAVTSLPGLVAALVIFLAYIVALEKEPGERAGPLASTTRRAAGWFLDFLLVLAALSAVLALLPLAGEALTTGRFQWQFERDSATALDWLLTLLGIGLMFTGMAFYWGVPPVRGGQTIGQAVLGLRVVGRSDTPPTLRASLLRGVMVPFAPLLWVTRFLSNRRSYFHDDIANVQMVTTRPASAA